jgi:uncharacterized protein YbjT (DUF2867 family)
VDRNTSALLRLLVEQGQWPWALSRLRRVRSFSGRTGCQVAGIARSVRKSRITDPEVNWIERDLTTVSANEWRALTEGADVLVNAAGALQDGAKDQLSAIHEEMVKNLVAGLEGSNVRFVQISAAGVSESASTKFSRSKARGDELLVQSGLDYVILRPTLVIGQQAYGGTALLRAAAAVPLMHFSILAESRVQTISIDDVAHAVVFAASGQVASGTIADLTEPDARAFGETVALVRQWLGLPPWRYSCRMPKACLSVVAYGADAAGWLGWRAPLRSTALRSLEDGVTGDPDPWIRAGGSRFGSMPETLAAMPSSLQERWFARLYLLLPLGLLTLAVFWILSGLIGLISFGEAAEVLTARGVDAGIAAGVVLVGSLIDIALGITVLIRAWAQRACLVMVSVCFAYLIGGSFLAPDLWYDPIGPLAKIMPVLVLSLTVNGLLDER